VRRQRHSPALSNCRQRVLKKFRGTHRERSSSDDSGNSEAEPVLFSLPIRRGLSARSVRTIAFRGEAVRCSIFALEKKNAFNCWFGKTSCSRHLATQLHNCSKIRTRMQQVSD
ncbi:hypothetical protein Angca_001786, partial [Angiostrongylus cantonensis]